MLFHVFARVVFKPLGEKPGLFKHEFTVQKVERLQGGRAAHAFGGDLSAIGAVESAEGRVLLHADLGHVNHPAPLVGSEFLFWIVNANVIIIGFKNAKARAAGAQFQLAADSEDRVSQRFCLEPLRWKTPEQT